MKRMLTFTLLLITLIAYAQEPSQSHITSKEQMSFEELQKFFRQHNFYKLIRIEEGKAGGKIITLAPSKEALQAFVKIRLKNWDYKASQIFNELLAKFHYIINPR